MTAQLSGEYFVIPKLGITLRLVSEKYTAMGTGKSYSGGHVGVFGNYYFF